MTMKPFLHLPRSTLRSSASARTLTAGKFHASARQFIERVFQLRLLGLAFGFVCVAGVLSSNGADPLIWTALVANAFFWPLVARRIALLSNSPRKAEFSNLLIDSAMGGVWIACMHFNLLPCVVLAVMLSIDKLSVGGIGLLWRGMLVQATACLLAGLLTGFTLQPNTSMFEIAMALPLLVGYPIAISYATYRLGRTVTRQNRRLAELTRIDLLSGLLNRGSWEELAMQELRRHQRGNVPAALLMIDIDHFKAVNDEHGHPAGDEAIRNVAAIIRRCVRDVDVPGRYGGDEFGIVLVHTDAAAAMRIADRIRLTVLAGSPESIPVSTMSVSIGIATNTANMHDMRAWIKRADVALLQAKARGRDCVAIAA